MADTPMSRLDKRGKKQATKLTAAIVKAKEQLASARTNLKRIRDDALKGQATNVLALASTLLDQIQKAVDNPSGVAALVEDFERETAEVQADLNEALNNDLTLAPVATVLAKISEIGDLARGL